MATSDADEEDPLVKNTGGIPGFSMEAKLTLLWIVGIEDPPWPNVAPAMAHCCRAGIDVRMVTGDNLATDIALAKRTGVMREELHCNQNSKALSKRAMAGKVFGRVVHDYKATFNQGKFNAVWP